MRLETIRWEYFKSFLQVVKTGSLSSAAANLGLTQPTVGRHITALEEAVGLALFVRSQNGFVATEESLGLLAYAQNMENNAAAFFREASVQGESLIGSVRISASEIVGSEILPSILATIKRDHPQLDFELVLSNQAHDLASRAADLAIRMFQPSQQNLISKKVAETVVGMHAHKQYLRRAGEPHSFADLKDHAFIGYDTENEFLRKFLKLLPGLSRDQCSFRSNSDIAQLAAIRAGFGIGVCQVPVVSKEKNIVRVLEKEFEFRMGIWVVMPEDLKNSRRCKAVFKALADGLEAYFA